VELEQEWQRIRRGWYLGGAGFRGRLLRLIKGKVEQGRLSSYVGQAKRAHGTEEAERVLAEGLAILGLKNRDLRQAPKGRAEKQVLAWWLRQETIVGRRWVSERLGMGEESGVSRAVRLVKAGRNRELNRMKDRLLRALIKDKTRQSGPKK